MQGYKWLYGDTYAGNHRENGIPAHRRDSVSLSPLNSCTASIITTIFSTGRKYLRTLEHLSTHLFRRAEWQTLLGIDAAALEGDILAVSLFEVLRIYTRSRALHRVERIETSLDEPRDDRIDHLHVLSG